jgi:hypothetical protein
MVYRLVQFPSAPPDPKGPIRGLFYWAIPTHFLFGALVSNPWVYPTLLSCAPKCDEASYTGGYWGSGPSREAGALSTLHFEGKRKP